MKRVFIFMIILTSLIFAQTKVGIVFSQVGLGDKGLNDSAYYGLEKAKNHFAIEFKYAIPEYHYEIDGYIEEFAENNYDLIIVLEPLINKSMEFIAKKYPNTKFLLLENRTNLPNISSINFNEEEMGFLAGALASLMTKTGTIGFVGGMETPIIQRFENGYRLGAEYIIPNINIKSSYISGQNPFNDPIRGEEETLHIINQGADVIYQLAGETGIGVIKAAKKSNAFVIGSEYNQDGLAQGVVLTSILKNIESVIYDTIKSIKDENFVGGVKTYDLSKNGISFTDFKYTKNIIGKENINKLETLKNDLSSLKLNLKLLSNSEENKLFKAIDNNNLKLLQDILEKNKLIITSYSSIYDSLPLDYAIKNDKLDVVKLFVENNIEVENTFKGYSALEIAVKIGNHEIIDYLISKGADVNCEIGYKKNILDLVNDDSLFEYMIEKGGIPKTIEKWTTVEIYDTELENFTGEIALLNHSDNDGWLRIRRFFLADSNSCDTSKVKRISEIKIGFYDDITSTDFNKKVQLKMKNEKNKISKIFNGTVWDKSNILVNTNEIEDFIDFIKRSVNVEISVEADTGETYTQSFNVEKLDKALLYIEFP